MRYPVVQPHSRRSTAPSGNAVKLLTGIILTHQAGTNVIYVRLPGAGDRVLKNVVIPHGFEFQAGDRVLIAKPSSEQYWVAIVRLQDPDQFGLTAANMTQQYELHQPGNFQMFASEQLIIAVWDAWTGRAGCFELQYGETTDPEFSQSFFTYGSHFIYKSTTPITLYARVRSMRYDVIRKEGYYGSWSDWENETSLNAISRNEFDQLRALITAHIEDNDRTLSLHLEGDT